MSAPAAPVGGPILTRSTRGLLALGALAMALLAWRFLAGLGPVTGLNDGYPWGLWIAFDVVTGTALACGGYAMALLVYVLNRGRYHPLVRPAILTSALGYSLAGAAVAIDVGRPWLMWKVPLFAGSWNFNSALLEVALCIMAYVVVLWIELAPAFLERWLDASGRLGRISRRVYPMLDRALLWIIALGLLLPTMHQSSLGTVMMLAGQKLHPLWQTPLLPLMFLIGCVGMGYALVVFESLMSSHMLRRKPETPMLGGLWGAASAAAVVFVALRLGDLAWRGEMAALFAFDGFSLLFLAEIALLLVPAALWLQPQRRGNRGELLQSAGLFLLGGTLYRFDTYLVAFDPGPGWTYFPTIPEMLITLGLVALEIFAYIFVIKRFPILTGEPSVVPA